MSVGPQSKSLSPPKPCFIIHVRVPVPVPSYTQKQKGREDGEVGEGSGDPKGQRRIIAAAGQSEGSVA
ncbi:putative TBC1 domain family member 5-like protein A-like isoform [Sesbania bispinosa]|nr:putative TBC1 domain family member 5-like protein A-like isoform [Sesbania bispinosa]